MPKLSKLPKLEKRGTQTDDSPQNFIVAARKALENGDYKKAEENLDLCRAVSSFSKNPNYIACIYDILSAIAFHNGNLPKAAGILEEAIEEISTYDHLKFTDHHLTDFRFRLVRILSTFPESETVENNFKEIVDDMKNFFVLQGSNKACLQYVDSLFRYAIYKINHGGYKEAENAIVEAFKRLKSRKITKRGRFLIFVSGTVSDLVYKIMRETDSKSSLRRFKEPLLNICPHLKR